MNTKLHFWGGGRTALAVVVGVAIAGVAGAASLPKLTAIKTPALKGKPPVSKLAAAPALTGVLKDLDDLKIDIPAFDLSASPVPDLKLSALALVIPQLPGRGALKNLATPVDTTYDPEISIPMPDLDIEAMMPAEASGAVGAEAVSGATGGVVAAPENGVPAGVSSGSSAGAAAGSSGSSAGLEANAANCAQFSSMPSASYCSSITDTNGQQLCSACKNAGF